MCYCIELDTRTGQTVVLDHHMREVPESQFQAAREAQGVAA